MIGRRQEVKILKLRFSFSFLNMKQWLSYNTHTSTKDLAKASKRGAPPSCSLKEKRKRKRPNRNEKFFLHNMHLL